MDNTIGQQGQGHFTEALLSNELLDNTFYRINRSVKEYLPSVMSGSRSTRNGMSIESNNLLYDFYTGQVVEATFRDSRNQVHHSRSVPAYTIYPGMGAKGDNGSNSHMLAQQAAFYTFKEKVGGILYNPLDPFNPQAVSILSAGVQTWRSDWTGYRATNASGTYEDESGTQVPIWRQAANYTWQSPLIGPDGTLGKFVDFSWGGTPASEWIKANETVRYDHFSHGLENRDVNGLYSSSKLGYNQAQLIATAGNARYTELVYSGAEDLITLGSVKYYGGEVATQGSQDNALAHTGVYSSRVTAGQHAFLYQAIAGRDLQLNKPYRLSAWIHTSDATAHAGQLFVEINGVTTATATIADAETRRAGNWYRLSLNIKLPASANGQLVKMGCRNTGLSGSAVAVNFDDFRCSPLNATTSGAVYDAKDGKRTFVLDNENLFTRSEYDKAGRLKRVYKETFDKPSQVNSGSKLLKEYDYNFANINSPSWESFEYRCKTSYGNPIGIDERRERAVDPANPASYIYSAWIENNNPSIDCKPCGPAPQYVFYVPTGGNQGTCIAGRPTYQTITVGSGSGRMCYVNTTYHYDGTNLPPYTVDGRGNMYSCPGTSTPPDDGGPKSEKIKSKSIESFIMRFKSK